MTPTPDEKTLLVEGHDSHHHGHENEALDLSEDVPFYSPPRQRQRWGEEQVLPHVNWGDLFFDLFYVGAAFNLGVLIMHETSARGLLYFISCFWPIYMTWIEKVMYHARFCAADNLLHRSWEFLHLFILATAIQHIRPVDEMSHTSKYPATFYFSLSLGLDAIAHIVWYWDIKHFAQGGPEARHAARNDMKRKLVSGAFYFVAAYMAGSDYFSSSRHHENNTTNPTNDIPIILCLMARVAEYAYILFNILVVIPLVGGGEAFNRIRVPVNVEFSIHRNGEWVMLMLGESILSLMIVEQSSGWRYTITFYSGILSVTLLQYMYYRSNPFAADDHAIRRSRSGAFVNFFMMTFYAGSLVLVGASYKSILHFYLEQEEEAEAAAEQQKEATGFEETEIEHDSEEEHRVQQIRLLFCWSLAVSLFTLDGMLASHRGLRSNLSRLWRRDKNGNRHFVVPALLVLVTDLGLLAFTATMPLWVRELHIMALVACAVLVGQVLLRTRGLRYFPVNSRSTSFYEEDEVLD